MARRLTQQQHRRIARQHHQRQDSWSRDDEEMAESQTTIAGRVIIRHGSHLTVMDQSGQLVHCQFRQNLGQPTCGDQVLWQPVDVDHGVVVALLPRTNVLERPNSFRKVRPLAANITQIFIVVASAPPPTAYLIDQYLVTAENLGANAVIVVNKCDLGELPATLDHYAGLGYPMLRVSVHNNIHVNQLQQLLTGHTSILLGQSGVGKSSLARILTQDSNILIQSLSEATGLGQHTTSTATFYPQPGQGGLIDSPGVRSFRLMPMDERQLALGFREFWPFLGHCRFNDCAHLQEPGCALRAAVTEQRIHPRRVDNFLRMREELRQQLPWEARNS